jgi:putative phosphoribosyl transferase
MAGLPSHVAVNPPGAAAGVHVNGLVRRGDLGLVICLMPLQGEGAQLRHQCLADVFGGSGLALWLRDSGMPDAPADGADAVQRLGEAIDAAFENQQRGRLSLGLLGMGPGSAAVLRAAAAWGGRLQAVVACGGLLRDGIDALPMLRLPALLIVGGAEELALSDTDRAALRSLPRPWRLETVPGARSCFTEPGCFETAVHHAASWFGRHVGPH